MNTWTLWLALPVCFWITHHTLLGLSRLVEPRCPRCGGRRWTQGRRGELSCATCPAVREQQIELELAA
jgi:tRNA(Ile2) C34 agmatinyltransferase TiaS